LAVDDADRSLCLFSFLRRKRRRRKRRGKAPLPHTIPYFPPPSFPPSLLGQWQIADVSARGCLVAAAAAALLPLLYFLSLEEDQRRRGGRQRRA